MDQRGHAGLGHPHLRPRSRRRRPSTNAGGAHAFPGAGSAARLCGAGGRRPLAELAGRAATRHGRACRDQQPGPGQHRSLGAGTERLSATGRGHLRRGPNQARRDRPAAPRGRSAALRADRGLHAAARALCRVARGLCPLRRPRAAAEAAGARPGHRASVACLVAGRSRDRAGGRGRLPSRPGRLLRARAPPRPACGSCARPPSDAWPRGRHARRLWLGPWRPDRRAWPLVEAHLL